MTKPEPITAAEPGLWQERLAVLREGLSTGKPGSLKVIRTEIARLDDTIKALANRREMAAQAAARMARHGAKASSIETRLLKVIEAEAAKVDDLRRLIKGLKRVEVKDDTGATPEVSARPAARDPIVLLEEAERKEPGSGLTHDQARAAKEIARVCEAVTRAGQAKAAQAQNSGKPSGGYNAPEMPAQIAEVHGTRYLPWADWWNDHDRVTLDICVKVSVYGLSLKALSRKHHMRVENVRKKLQAGLDKYWRERELLPLYADKQRRAKDEFDRRRYAPKA